MRRPGWILVVLTLAAASVLTLSGQEYYRSAYSAIVSGLGTTSTDGFSLLNNTPATVGTPVQISPRLRYCGTAYNSTSTLSEINCMFDEVLPATVAGTTTATWRLGYTNNGGAAVYPFTVTSAGGLATAGNNFLVSGNNLTLATGGQMASTNFAADSGGIYSFVNRANMTSPSDGNMVFRNAATTIGSQVKVDALPTIASGFGTSPSVTAGSTPFAGSINVGTGGTATTGVINFNGTAFPSAPFCTVGPRLTNVPTRPTTITTTQLTLTTSTAWTASDIVTWVCPSSK